MSIPKVLYLYWGNETISFLRAFSITSFASLNPDWHVVIIKNHNQNEQRRWQTGETSDKDYYTGEDYSYVFDRFSNIELKPFNFDRIYEIDPKMADVHVKDILNWFLLSTSGGFVVDTDVLFFKPFAEKFARIALNDIALTCFKNLPAKDYIPVTFMGSSPNNPFFSKIYENAKKFYRPNDYQSCGTYCMGYRTLEEIAQDYQQLSIYDLGDIIYPFMTQYSFNSALHMIHFQNCFSKIPDNVIGIHWYGGCSIARKSNENINHENCMVIENTLTAAIKVV